MTKVHNIFQIMQKNCIYCALWHCVLEMLRSKLLSWHKEVSGLGQRKAQTGTKIAFSLFRACCDNGSFQKRINTVCQNYSKKQLNLQKGVLCRMLGNKTNLKVIERYLGSVLTMIHMMLLGLMVLLAQCNARQNFLQLNFCAQAVK